MRETPMTRVRSASESPIGIVAANRALAHVVAAFALVTVGEWGYVTALSVDAFRRDGTIAVGYVGLRLFLAAGSSFFNGLAARHRDPGRTLSAIGVARASIVGGSAALAASSAPLGLLIGLLGLDALVSAAYRPAQSALVPQLARTPKELVATAASLSTVKTLSQALGSVAGGLLLAAATPPVVFSAMAALFAVAALVTVPYARHRGPVRVERPRPELGAVLRGMRLVVQTPDVGSILLVSGLRTFVRGMWIAIAVIASLKLLHAGSAGVGLLMLAAGIGSLIAAPLSSRIVSRSHLGTPAALALVGCGVPLALIAGFPVFYLALALVTAWGIGMAVADVTTSSLLQRLLSTPSLPRVTGAIESTKLALEGLGGFLAPVLISTIGVRGALLAAAAPLPLVVARDWNTLHRVDAAAQERAAMLELLHRVPWLAPLDMASLDALIARLSPMFVPHAGVDVVRQHEHGDRFYVIEEGSAEVLVDDYAVGTLGPGDSFGERALLRDVPRTATVRSLEPVRMIVLDRDDFLAAVTGLDDPIVGPTQVAAGARRTWTHLDRAEVLSRLNLFAHLGSERLAQLADRSVVQRWGEGEAIVEQGTDGDRYFVVLDGTAHAMVDGRRVSELRPGDQFGEIALLHGVPRSATVVAVTPVTALGLDRKDFLRAVNRGRPRGVEAAGPISDI